MGNEFTGYTCICVPGFFGVNCEDEAYQVDSAADVVELVFENNSRGDDADPVLQHGCFCSRLRSETKYREIVYLIRTASFRISFPGLFRSTLF